jgi:hypothetical protein
MSKRVAQRIKTGEDKAGPGESRLRLTSGEEVSIRRGSSVTYEVALSEAECSQLLSEGYDVRPGLDAYRKKKKQQAKPKKKTGAAVKDIAAPSNQEESK